MPKIAYEEWKPNGESLRLITIAEEICEDYAQQGYDLTLRQIYYRFVARGEIPNNLRSYKNLGNVINKARLAGRIDWNHIVDRTRNLRALSHWDNPDSIIRSAANSFALDKWADQPARVEVWVEKEALAGVVSRVADRHDCAWFSCRGYVSQSELWGAARRHLRYIQGGQRVVVVHLGDHDPSGIDMTRDITQRLHQFLDRDWINDHIDEIPVNDSEGTIAVQDIRDHMTEWLNTEHAPITVNRIALNMPQIEQYNPPPNPAKLTDSRAKDYLERFGTESWELDALDPSVLDRLIDDAIMDVQDPDLYFDQMTSEEDQRQVLLAASSRWQEVRDFLNA
jgi:hypothetical protein